MLLHTCTALGCWTQRGTCEQDAIEGAVVCALEEQWTHQRAPLHAVAAGATGGHGPTRGATLLPGPWTHRVAPPPRASHLRCAWRTSRRSRSPAFPRKARSARRCPPRGPTPCRTCFPPASWGLRASSACPVGVVGGLSQISFGTSLLLAALENASSPCFMITTPPCVP